MLRALTLPYRTKGVSTTFNSTELSTFANNSGKLHSLKEKIITSYFTDQVLKEEMS